MVMESKNKMQLARYLVSFSWIYHGLFPKLIHIAPLEQLMTASLGFSTELSYYITKAVGVSELLFGIILFIFYRNRTIVLLNIVALVGLLLFVAVLQPQLLIEAFNPVTTNIPLIGLSWILLNEVKEQKRLDVS
nr:DoxX-like family protein [Catenovulum agarivorans]